MVGSILTPKPYPKDIDFLVSVTNACDLAPLALAGRCLRGRAQALNHTAAIFLVSEDCSYLGRTCPWRDCRPGLRVSCDALHCGARQHLHDDIATIALEPDLLRLPPLELWPVLTVRTALPSDVQAWVEVLTDGPYEFFLQHASLSAVR